MLNTILHTFYSFPYQLMWNNCHSNVMLGDLAHLLTPHSKCHISLGFNLLFHVCYRNAFEQVNPKYVYYTVPFCWCRLYSQISQIINFHPSKKNSLLENWISKVFKSLHEDLLLTLDQIWRLNTQSANFQLLIVLQT